MQFASASDDRYSLRPIRPTMKTKAALGRSSLVSFACFRLTSS